MPDDSTNPVCFGGDEISAGYLGLYNPQVKTPPAPRHAVGHKLPYRHRRASVVEFFVALGVIFFALVRIVTARGDETSFSYAPTPILEMRSFGLGTPDR